jgi:hypothetical protein
MTETVAARFLVLSRGNATHRSNRCEAVSDNLNHSSALLELLQQKLQAARRFAAAAAPESAKDMGLQHAQINTKELRQV